MSRNEVAVADAPRLSLLDLEQGWLPLMESRMEAEEIEDPEQRAAAIIDADVALANHATAEVQKADGVIGFRRFLESIASGARQEKRRQEKRCALAENMLRQLDASVIYAMDSVNRKRIDGQRGALTIRNNGGVQPLIIADESLLPDDVMTVHVEFRGDFWRWIEHNEPSILEALCTPKATVTACKPDTAAIRAKLSEPCAAVTGGVSCTLGRLANDGPPEDWPVCPACGGTGRNAIPGAYLADRGRQVRVL